LRISTKRALARFVPSQSSPAANVILAQRLLGSVRLVLKPAETSSKSKNVARRCTPPRLDDRTYAAFAATCASLCAVSTSTDEVQFIVRLLRRSVFAGRPHPKQNCCRHSVPWLALRARALAVRALSAWALAVRFAPPQVSCSGGAHAELVLLAPPCLRHRRLLCLRSAGSA